MLIAARGLGPSACAEAALVHGQDLPEADESYALTSPYPYCRTKALAEQAVRYTNDVPGGFLSLWYYARASSGSQVIRPC
jgi:hypothetical protein